jgi:hypothetical protein
MSTGYSEAEPSRPDFFPETLAIIEALRTAPTTPLSCAHGDGSPAVAVYDVPEGCVAIPGVETQPICPQHHNTDGSFHGMFLVIDLTVDKQWSQHTGEEPPFWIGTDPETGQLSLMQA